MTSIDLSSNRLCGVWMVRGGLLGGLQQKGTYDATGIKAIADALSVSSSMTSVDLSSNLLGGHYGDMTGIKAIADALSVSTSMNSLK